MRRRPPVFQSSDSLTFAEVERYTEDWIADGEVRQFSEKTLSERQLVRGKLLWHLRQAEAPEVGTREIRAFLAYLNRGHEDPGGRWGNPQCKSPVKPSTVKAYFRVLHAFCEWLIEEGVVDTSPMARMKPPVVRNDQIQPFTPEQIEALRQAARKTDRRWRDEALILFLLDTGCRVSEACALRLQDVDLQGRRCRVRGKGGKERSLPFGIVTRKALWQYLQHDERDDQAPLFASVRGSGSDEALTRYGILQLVERLGKTADLSKSVRCSPHTFRHTFAITYLRNGGDVFTLKELLGHTSLAIVNRYLAIAQADIEAQHRRCSPVDRLCKRK